MKIESKHTYTLNDLDIKRAVYLFLAEQKGAVLPDEGPAALELTLNKTEKKILVVFATATGEGETGAVPAVQVVSTMDHVRRNLGETK